MEENHYYPFGLKHKNYNVEHLDFDSFPETGVEIVPTENPMYKYKYQGQERQDELGLNWDSFKWRNYDYAIGRFMSIDKLAEDYNYQSPNNFSNNRVVDGREIEGLKWTSSTSSDGKTVNLNLNVKTVNKIDGVISNEQMSMLANERATALGSTIGGGKDMKGRNVTVSVTYSDKATMIWEYNMGIDISTTKRYDGETIDEIKSEASVASGWTDEIGNTQVNRTQINLALPWSNARDNNGQLKFNAPDIRSLIARFGTHEDGHTLGGRHETSKKLSPRLKALQSAFNMLMNTGAPSTVVSPEQRTEFINLVENQQNK